MIDRYKKRLDKAKMEKSSYMSNAKWFKFFSAMQQVDTFLPESQVKFLANDERTYLFCFGIDFDKKGILDGLACGPFNFNDIEWIFIPAIQEHERFNRKEKLQSFFEVVDLSIIENRLKQLGQYEFEIDENGLKLYGYK